jgi:DNA-directed RNA polymerase subunit RPC12/RpoP
MRLVHALVLTGILSVGSVGGAFAGHTPKHTARAAKSAAAASMYECAHCNIKMTAKEAKAHGMKCSSCGAKLTMVKKPAAAAKTKKS